jgi:hypothetical protein
MMTPKVGENLSNEEGAPRALIKELATILSFQVRFPAEADTYLYQFTSRSESSLEFS